MKVTIHRGQNQIGGSIIEIATESTRLIFDIGMNITNDSAAVPLVEGLFQGESSVDAVFVSHYHDDHVGLYDNVLKDVPIYIGFGAAKVINASRKYLNKEEIPFSNYFEDRRAVRIGDVEITPYLCDHSAFDSYMFHIKCGNKAVVYSGDFRSNGRKSFINLIKTIPKADALIIEGTTLSRPLVRNRTEVDLERLAINEISQTNGPVFVLQAATNIDRIVTFYKAARRCNRIFLQDLYMAEIAVSASDSIPNPLGFYDVRAFITNGCNKRYKLLDSKYKKVKIGRYGISKKSFVMCVRPSMKSYLEKLADVVNFDGGVLFYSMWQGYKENADIESFLQFMKDKGIRVINLHTSGHADQSSLSSLIKAVNPKFILPVHTENSHWFEKFDSVKVIYDKEVFL